MCMLDDSADAEAPEFVRETHPTARKSHRCHECGRSIEPGETYTYAAGKSEGWFWVYCMCSHCEAAARWLTAACSGYLSTLVEEDLREHVVGDEKELRSAPLTRLYRWMRADWQDRDGNLRPLDDVKALTDQAIERYRRQYAQAVA